ncbi:DNA-binding SARP family transcriptional activator [Actinoplanes xinjiangensis]|uniref:DNA-binding SARP family transcriptional activator n=3 Tax=Actinoplanes xinjiangensis TaxID=512350 RepID=A0A316FVG7_9ACTN|nr:BTAD domain-containing putative transcriptional regulator [Actinoplanes xinjiangensis]PWK52312.1 DNA-binding SARP family transcriptional activator [Actinoplanes xinjiangensis]
MRFGILGPVRAERPDGTPIPLGGPRLRALLAMLLLDAGRAVPIDRLIDGLYGDTPPAGAANALQSQVSRLRQSLPVELGPAGYRLAAAPDDVDVHRFAALAADGHRALAAGEPQRAVTLLREAAGLWRGEPLVDVRDAPFAQAQAARLGELRLTALENRYDAELALPAPLPADAITELRDLIAAHPLRERPRALLMRALAAEGRPAEALTAFEDARRTLADELGADPSPELSALHTGLLRHHPGPRPGPARHGVPSQLTSFVGRDGELSRVAGALRTRRLVTLHGPGGAGKTRLAAEAASRHDGDVWFVELAGAGPDGVPSAVQAALGLRDVLVNPPAAPAHWQSPAVAAPGAVDRLVAALADRHLLLVLDNCEHVIDAAAALAGRLLAGAPGLRILATSREPLGITGEALLPVGGLPVPPESPGAPAVLPAGPIPGAPAVLPTGPIPGASSSGSVPGASPHDPLPGAAPSGPALPGGPEVADLAGFPAVRLFLDRAADVVPGFAVTAANAGAIRRLCRTLDGLPLAVELAAARLHALPVTEIAARLGDRFRLLSAGSRTAADRHRTLQAVVAWSWDLLTEPERVLARRFTVFTGGATLDAVERICGFGTPPGPEPATGTGPPSEAGTASATTGARPPSEAAIGFATTGARPPSEAGTGFATTGARPPSEAGTGFATTGARPRAEAAVHVTGLRPEVVDVLAGLVGKSLIERDGDRYRMLETIRAFCAERLAESGERDRWHRGHAAYFLEFAERADPYLRGRDQIVWLDRLDADRDNLHAALRRSVAHGATGTGLRLVAALSFYWWLRGLRNEAATLSGLALREAGPEPPPGHTEEYVLSVFNAALSNRAAADRPVARWADYMRTLTAAPAHPFLLYLSAMAVGPPSDDPGDIVELNRRLRAQIAGDPWSRALGSIGAGWMVLFSGADPALAEPEFRTSLDGFRALGDRWGTMLALSGLAELASWRGDPAAAIAPTAEALRLAGELGSAVDVADLLRGRAQARMDTGDLGGAAADFTRAAEQARAAGAPELLAAALLGLGSLALTRAVPAPSDPPNGGIDDPSVAGSGSPNGNIDRDALAEASRYGLEALAACPAGWYSADGTRMTILVILGRIAEMSGDPVTAEARYREVFTVRGGMLGFQVMAEALDRLAGLAVAAGRPERAARLLGAVQALGLRSDPEAAEPARTTAGAARAVLGPQRFAAALAAGAALTPDEAVNLPLTSP